MTGLFAPYQESLDLKELGFDEECLGHYKTIKGGVMTSFFIEQPPIDESGGVFITKAPLYQQAFRWFREKHNIVFYLNMVGVNLYYYVIGTEPFLSFKTYEEAELACLKKLIEIVKNNL